MGKLKALALSAAFLGPLGSAALGADLPPPPTLPPAPYVEPEYNGWYLRGDAGIGMSNKPGLNYDVLTNGYTNICGCVRDPGSFLSQDLADQGIIGIGAGYAINSWFRTDATLEYRSKAAFSGVDQYSAQILGEQVPVDNNYYTVNGNWRGNVSSTVGLANAYVDLGTWNGLTPYVGAGVGFAYNRTSGISEIGTYYNPILQAYAVHDQQYSNGQGRFNFAWALMTGLTYNVSANTKLELGYRYINLGKAVTGSEIALAPVNTGVDNLKTKSLTAHDFRLGMRWMLGAPTTTAYAEPLIRKY